MKWATLLAVTLAVLVVSTGEAANSVQAYTGCDISASGLSQPHAGKATDWRLFLKPGGNLKAHMIFVDFSDAPADEDSKALYNRLASSASWYASSSRGAMSLSFSATYKWFRMPKPASNYRLTSTPSFSEGLAFFRDALRAGNATIDYRGYDLVYVVAARRAGFHTYAFYAMPGSGVVVDGVEVRHGMSVGSNTRDRWGQEMLHHNLGHLFGLPDLYAFANSGLYDQHRYVGSWDVMSWHVGASPFLAWQQYKLGWLRSGEVICLDQSGSTTRTLTPIDSSVEGLKAILVRVGPSRLYAIEARTLRGNDGRFCDSGVLVSKVDATLASGYGPIKLAPARTAVTATKEARCGPLYEAAYDIGTGEVSVFRDPAAGVKLTVLSEAGGSYRVRVTRD